MDPLAPKARQSLFGENALPFLAYPLAKPAAICSRTAARSAEETPHSGGERARAIDKVPKGGEDRRVVRLSRPRAPEPARSE